MVVALVVIVLTEYCVGVADAAGVKTKNTCWVHWRQYPGAGGRRHWCGAGCWH